MMKRSPLPILYAFLFAFAGVGGAGPAQAEFRAESVDNDFPFEIEAAAEEGKFLVIMFHQLGCPYCDKMRARVFPDPKVQAFYSGKFVMIESNKRGDLDIVTPDGKAMKEKDYGRKLRIRATPTFIFFDKNGKKALRVTGFMDVNRFNKAGKYVFDGVYKTKKSFFRYLQQSK